MTASSVDLEQRVQELESELESFKKKRAPAKRRVTFEFTEETYRLLKVQADRKQTSMANIVREAIGRTMWLEETVENGRLFVREDDGEIYLVKRL